MIESHADWERFLRDRRDKSLSNFDRAWQQFLRDYFVDVKDVDPLVLIVVRIAFETGYESAELLGRGVDKEATRNKEILNIEFIDCDSFEFVMTPEQMDLIIKEYGKIIVRMVWEIYEKTGRGNNLAEFFMWLKELRDDETNS